MLRHKSADVAQSVERRLGKAEVTGSIPVISFLVSDYKSGTFLLYRKLQSGRKIKFFIIKTFKMPLFVIR